MDLERRTESEDVTLWTVKTGYRVVDQHRHKIGCSSCPDRISPPNGSELNGTLLGFDFVQYFSKQASISFNGRLRN